MAAAAGQKRAFSSDTHSGTHVLRRRTCPAARRKLSIKRQVATARTTSSDLARDSERTHAGHSREVQATARAASRVSALVHSISGTRTSSSKPARERSASWRPNLVASKPGGVNADKRRGPRTCTDVHVHVHVHVSKHKQQEEGRCTRKVVTRGNGLAVKRGALRDGAPQNHPAVKIRYRGSQGGVSRATSGTR